MVQHSYNGNKYKLKSVLISLIVTFIIIIFVPVFLYITNNPLLQIGGELLMQLARIAFLLIATPVAIITLFLNYRRDTSRNKTGSYPMGIELTGIIVGFILGLFLSAEWAFMLTISLGLIWADPFLYAPFPVLTTLMTYLCFKAAQFFYARTHKMPQKQNFRFPMLLSVFSIPALLYSAYGLFLLAGVILQQNTITIANLQELPSENSYMFVADLTVPETGLYHVTASVGPTPHLTTPLALRINGVVNLDELYNFQLAKGVNQLTYHPSTKDCAFTQNPAFSSYITFSVSNVIGGRIASPLPQQIKITITCHK